MAIDRVLLEILRNHYQAIVEDMARIMERTAYTTFVKETADFSTGLAVPELRSGDRGSIAAPSCSRKKQSRERSLRITSRRNRGFLTARSRSGLRRSSRGFLRTDEMQQNLARVGTAAMLGEKDALPRAERERPSDDRHM